MLGSAKVQQIFRVKDPKQKKLIDVAGSKVLSGDLEKQSKYRVVRLGKVLQDNLKLSSLKRMQQDVTKVESGLECGIAFSNFEGEVQPGDIIECYKEAQKTQKFNKKPGIFQSY